MSEIHFYEAQVKKMQGLCEEHNLVYRFQKEKYPLTFTIKPSQDMDAQLSMLEDVENVGYRSPKASMTWIFNDGVLETKVRGGTFTISKTLRTKIENILIKMIAYWQQFFFREIIERGILNEQAMPKIEDEAVMAEDEELFPEDEASSVADESAGNNNADDAEGNDAGEDENSSSDDGSGLTDGDTSKHGSSALVSLEDPEVNAAARIVRAANGASCALLKREMGISGAKAVRLLEALETLGVVGPFNGSRPRDVLPCDEPDDGEVLRSDEA